MHIGIVPHPAVPVTSTDSTGSDSNDRPVRVRDRVAHVLNSQWSLKLFKNGNLHGIGSEIQGMQLAKKLLTTFM
jgi:hypothetical protein